MKQSRTSIAPEFFFRLGPAQGGMKRVDRVRFAEQDMRRQQPVEEAVAALVPKFQARTGVWSRQFVSRLVVTVR